MLRFLLKVLALPLLLVLSFICLLGKWATNISAFAFNLLMLVIIGSIIFCITKADWTNLAILAAMGFVAFLAIVAIVAVLVTMENIRDSLGEFIRS